MSIYIDFIERDIRRLPVKILTGLTLVAIIAASTATTAFAQGSGADTYKSKCAMCHAADGTASGPTGKAMNVPSFKSSAAVKASDADLIGVTKNGKGKMPAYAGKLTDAQIKDAVAYIRTLQK
jgi:mono/diheme cytochrome c family protein